MGRDFFKIPQIAQCKGHISLKCHIWTFLFQLRRLEIDISCTVVVQTGAKNALFMHIYLNYLVIFRPILIKVAQNDQVIKVKYLKYLIFYYNFTYRDPISFRVFYGKYNIYP